MCNLFLYMLYILYIMFIQFIYSIQVSDSTYFVNSNKLDDSIQYIQDKDVSHAAAMNDADAAIRTGIFGRIESSNWTILELKY